MGLLNIFKKDGTFKNDKSIIVYSRYSCNDKCKWKCDFDKDAEVFCHCIGRDLTKEEVNILKLVGCSSWRRKKEG